MCLAVCGKLEKIDGHNGEVSIMGTTILVNIDLIEEPKIGDNLLIHTGCAISKVDEVRAKEIEENLFSLLDEVSND